MFEEVLGCPGEGDFQQSVPRRLAHSRIRFVGSESSSRSLISDDQRRLAVLKGRHSENLNCIRGRSRRFASNDMLGTEDKKGFSGFEQPFARDVVSIGTLNEEPNDRAFWLSRSAEERIAGVEFLCRQFYSYASAEPEFRRFVEVVDLPTYGDCAPL